MQDAILKNPLFKPAVVIGLVIVSLALEVLVHAYLNISVAFTHIFYLPIVIAGIWYYKKAVLLALFLGVLHIAVEYSLAGTLFDPAAVIRAVMFVLVAYVIGSLSESKDLLAEEREKKHKALLGFIAEVGLRIKTPMSVIRENLDEIGRGIETGEMTKEEVQAALQIQISHAEKILATLREMNQGVIDEQKDIPESYRDLLTR
jgi:signal transduction histidine kinase